MYTVYKLKTWNISHLIKAAVRGLSGPLQVGQRFIRYDEPRGLWPEWGPHRAVTHAAALLPRHVSLSCGDHSHRPLYGDIRFESPMQSQNLERMLFFPSLNFVHNCITEMFLSHVF